MLSRVKSESERLVPKHSADLKIEPNDQTTSKESANVALKILKRISLPPFQSLASSGEINHVNADLSPSFELHRSKILFSAAQSGVENLHQTLLHTRIYGHLSATRCVQLHPVRPWLISASDDCTCKVFSTEAFEASILERSLNGTSTDAMLFSFRGHEGPITSLALSINDGEYIYTGSVDCTVRKWKIPTSLVLMDTSISGKLNLFVRRSIISTSSYD